MCTQHLGYRPRNCYSLAINKMSKYLQYETRDRRTNERDLWDLQRLRIEGAATELDYDSWNMREALTRDDAVFIQTFPRAERYPPYTVHPA